ncbi:MAG: hypothetical protein HKN03_04320 [Acidimicrobiales bacterium]|nr:hypothetical protein [Acidimicrobiales bacterium]
METTTQITIERPADLVFSVVSDMSRNPEWQKGMKSCTWTSDPPIREGSTYDQVAEFLTRNIITSFEVVEFEPDRKIRIKSVKSTFPLDITRSVEPTGEFRCQVTAVVTGEPSGVLKWLNPMIKPLVARSVRKDYERLKVLLDG